MLTYKSGRAFGFRGGGGGGHQCKRQLPWPPATKPAEPARHQSAASPKTTSVTIDGKAKDSSIPCNNGRTKPPYNKPEPPSLPPTLLRWRHAANPRAQRCTAPHKLCTKWGANEGWHREALRRTPRINVTRPPGAKVQDTKARRCPSTLLVGRADRSPDRSQAST